MLFVGEMPTKAKEQSGGLQDLVDDIKGGLHDKRALADKYGATYVRTYRGIAHMIDMYKKPPVYQRREKPRNAVWFGTTGSGKTYDAEQQAIDAEKSMMKIPMKQVKQGWYDGYQGEEIILFDDFRGSSMEPHEFLNLLDGLPRLPVKGDFIENKSTILFFTSAEHPINWWPKWYAKSDNNWAQVKRRLDHIYQAQDYKITEIDKDEAESYKEQITVLQVK